MRWNFILLKDEFFLSHDKVFVVTIFVPILFTKVQKEIAIMQVYMLFY